jgi:ferredoxin
MPRLYSHRDRPVHLGPLPAERLARDPQARPLPAVQPADHHPAGPDSVAAALAEYLGVAAALFDGPVAPATAPLPVDPALLRDHLKAAACFLDATLAGVCRLGLQDGADGAGASGAGTAAADHDPDPADHAGPATGPATAAAQPAPAAHTHALVFAVEFGRDAAEGEPGAAWVRGTHAARTDLRCAEVAAVLAGYLRALGWPATAHVHGHTALDLPVLAQRAGVAQTVDGVLALPFSRRGFRLGVVTTTLALACDAPIAPGACLDWPDAAAWLGVGGTRPGFDDDELAARPLHLGRHPMERVPRVDEPTTRIDRSRIQRVPKRADLFTRALAGDLGPRAQAERTRFAVKHPLAAAMVPFIRALVPLQGTREPLAPTGPGGALADPTRNADAVKALAYHLGAELVGLCEAEPWMWYSHDEVEGRPIEPYHRHAVVMLIDQGYETMDGASGDDWISGAQSMRAYLRGALIAGVMSAHLRRLGWSSRVHSNAHSELLHLPAVLMAGLGELSRIGELVLNPFIGPRSKSVVLTTALPLAHDRPIDFGLQDACAQCLKCARECPCNAIPYGPKIEFNGYEIWKPDVEKCGKYRLTNMKGSACGRCMKTCPYDREDLAATQALLWRAIATPEGRRELIAHDERTGAGGRNPVKRWWLDLEIVDGVAVAPRAGTNERDLEPGREQRLAPAQKIAIFPPALQPAGGTTLGTVVPLDRAAGLAAAEGARGSGAG